MKRSYIKKQETEWDLIRPELKKKFGWARITSCELNYPGCWKDQALSFAHCRKRRHLLPGELKVVILVCNPCHAQIEKLPEDQMAQIVYDVIKTRKVQP